MTGLDVSGRTMMAKRMAQDHVNGGTVRNLNREDVIGMPEQLPPASWRIWGMKELGVWARDGDTEDAANSNRHSVSEL